VQRSHRSEEQNPQIAAYAGPVPLQGIGVGTNFTNIIYTRLAAFPSRKKFVKNESDNQQPPPAFNIRPNDSKNGFSGSSEQKSG
jgi:hypothetical protein